MRKHVWIRGGEENRKIPHVYIYIIFYNFIYKQQNRSQKPLQTGLFACRQTCNENVVKKIFVYNALPTSIRLRGARGDLYSRRAQRFSPPGAEP